MGVNKIIKFYVMDPEPCFINPGLPNNSPVNPSYTIFKKAFPKIDYYEMEFGGKQILFDLNEFDESYMFGTCATRETIKASNFMRQRDINTKETKPFTTINNESQLESYTFYYVDFIHNRMAVIANKKISKIHEAFSQFIYETTGQTAMINIFPELVQDLKAEAKKFIKPSWLEFDFGSVYGKNNIPCITDALSKDISPEKYRISIKLSKVENSIFDKLIDLKNNKSENDLEGLKITGKNDLGVEETLNFFEAVYTKTVPLQLTDDNEINLDYIKRKLKENLDIHLGIFA